MASIGRADLLIVPKFDGLSNAVNKALGNVDMSASGKSGGTSFANGFKGGLSTLTGGAVMGAVSAVTTKAIDAITSHMSDAVARLDTLKNYPVVMQSLGVSAREADASISTMSDRLSTLPTRLDTMTSSVQGIYAATKDYGVSLQTATDAGLAMNDLLLAGGQGMEVTNAAMEQFRQILSKGKPEMQDWKTLISAAPGQMDQLAKSMLGPTANANDLYEALGGGKNDPTITMEELLQALIRLDKEGGAGLESLQSQAEKATGGIATSMANAENAITRGLAATMDAIGRDRISGFFNGVRGAIDGFFGVVQSVVPQAIDIISGIDPAFVAAAAGASLLVDAGPRIATGLRAAIAAFNPLTAGLTLATATLGFFAIKAMETAAANESMARATTTFNDAVMRSASLDEYAGQIDGIGVAANTAKVSMTDFYASMQRHADAMQANNAKAEETIATYNVIGSVMDEYAGKAEEGVRLSDLSAEAQGRLAFAASELSGELGAAVSAEDILNGTYVDQEGNVQDLTQSVRELIEARKEEARTAALTENLKHAYSMQADAVNQVKSAQDDYNASYEKYINAWNEFSPMVSDQERGVYATADAYAKAKLEQDGMAQAVRDANGALNDANLAVETYTSELGMSATSAGDLKNAIMGMADEAGNTLVSALSAAGVDVNELATKMANAGVSTEKLQQVGSASLAALARACHGNVDLMVNALNNLDGIDIHDKDFIVTDDGTIVFKRGQLTELDKQKLRDKGFIVTDNGTAVTARRSVDAVASSILGVPTYRHSTVKADVYGTSDVWRLVNAIDNVTSKSVYVGATIAMGGWATGAFVSGGDLLASAVPARGLYERMKSLGNVKQLFHADGGIVDSPTLTSVGFVGENGAEAIVPLSNRQYVRPFARVLADEMGSGTGPLIKWLDAHLGEIIAAYAPTATPREMRRMNQKVAAYA